MRFQKLLILDLDETLIHATTEPLPEPPDYLVGEYAIYKRPGVDAFLAWCLQDFERVAIWTASTADYATEVLAALLPVSRLAFVWARERCTRHLEHETRDYVWLKDLKKVRRRGVDLATVIAVDDTPGKFRRNYGNLVAIRAFEGDPQDGELRLLRAYLAELAVVADVRPVEKRGWRRRVLAKSSPL